MRGRRVREHEQSQPAEACTRTPSCGRARGALAHAPKEAKRPTDTRSVQSKRRSGECEAARHERLGREAERIVRIVSREHRGPCKDEGALQVDARRGERPIDSTV